MSPPCINNTDADEFRRMLDVAVPKFLTQITLGLESIYNLDVGCLQADHVCWRTGSQSEYGHLVSILQNHPDSFELLIESEVGGRPIATFALHTPITTSQYSVHVIEIPSPKESSFYPAGLEHVEFVIGDGTCTSPWNDDIHQATLQGFQQKHPNVPWNTKAMSKQVNPDISLKLSLDGFGTCSAKFHLMTLEDVIAAEKLDVARKARRCPQASS